MSLDELYQEVILDHNKRPRNYGPLAGALEAHGHNPLCGDRLTLYVQVADDRVADIRFEGSVCAISKSSASLMTEAVKGKSLADAETLFTRFQEMITRPWIRSRQAAVGKLAVSAACSFPSVSSARAWPGTRSVQRSSKTRWSRRLNRSGTELSKSRHRHRDPARPRIQARQNLLAPLLDRKQAHERRRRSCVRRDDG